METKTHSRDLHAIFDPIPSGTAFLSPSPEISFTALSGFLSEESRIRPGRNIKWKGAFLFSLLIHLLIGFALVTGVYSPDKRTVKTVNHWVVNLVTDLNALPKGLQEGTSEALTLITSKKKQPPAPEIKAAAEEKVIPVTRGETEISKPIEPAAEEKVPENFPETPPAVSPETVKQVGDTPIILQESMNQQIQMGQFALAMGANDQTKLLKMQYFLKNFKEQLRGLIRISIREDTLADFRDKTASIIIHYPLEEKEENIVTSPDSDMEWAHTLKEKIDWSSLTSPLKFGLPNKSLKIKVGLQDQNEILVMAELL